VCCRPADIEMAGFAGCRDAFPRNSSKMTIICPVTNCRAGTVLYCKSHVNNALSPNVISVPQIGSATTHNGTAHSGRFLLQTSTRMATVVLYIHTQV
jgi:hypothetical protein